MITIHDNQSVFQGSKVATSIFQRKVPPKGANFDFFMGQKSLFPTETLPTNFFETVSVYYNTFPNFAMYTIFSTRRSLAEPRSIK